MSAPAATSAFSKDNPFPAKITENRLLNKPGSAKETRHFIVSLGDSGLSYKAGDSLGVFPTNRPIEVAEIVEKLGATGDELVSPAMLRLLAPISLHEALTHKLALGSPTSKIINTLFAKAADIGTAAHQWVNWWLRGQLGESAGPEPGLTDASLWATMGFTEAWEKSGLRVVRTEQPVWCPKLGTAGTIDVIAEDVTGKFGGGLGILDLKTSRGVYESHHVQVATYMEMGSRWAPMQWGAILRIPKNTDDPNTELHALGELYGGRRATQQQLVDVFRGALVIWENLVRPVG